MSIFIICLVMKFGKKLKDLSNAKIIEPQVITGINRLVCTSKNHNVELKGTNGDFIRIIIFLVFS